MQTDILIVGGGLSGLMAGWSLQRANADFIVVEARPRFGGRVYTRSSAFCDMGPSWFWQGQPVIMSLLNHFGIGHYEQFADGKVLFEQADGRTGHTIYQSPMTGSLRVLGGVQALADALANNISAERRLLEHSVRQLTLSDEVITASITTPDGDKQIQANKVALAIPPRLGAELAFSPALPDSAMSQLTNTPTWMAGHAKFFAIYEQPFWRDEGLCGTAMSRLGPLAEIHDASPNSGNQYCLFGFSGLDSVTRAQIGKERFEALALEQLGRLFGEEATKPTETHFQDWSAEPFTASQLDQQPQTRHPDYGLSLDLGRAWGDKLAFISSESSYTNGGLIEGALESGYRYAQAVAEIDTQSINDDKLTHSASMDWDWLK